VFGWFSRAEYIREEWLEHRGVSFTPTTVEELKAEFTATAGAGYYVHPDFLGPASDRARSWISKFYDHFNGTSQRPIPGFCRFTKEPLHRQPGSGFVRQV
jgi:hypothetical protein